MMMSSGLVLVVQPSPSTITTHVAMDYHTAMVSLMRA